MPYSRGVINAKPRLVDSTSTAVTNEMRCFSTKIIYGEAGIYMYIVVVESIVMTLPKIGQPTYTLGIPSPKFKKLV